MKPTQEQVIAWARKAGLEEVMSILPDGTKIVACPPIDLLERFAALAAAAEREKVARWQIGSGYATGHGDTIEDLLVELEWQVRESEREACAKVCEDDCGNGALNLAEAIRARGES